MIKRILGGAAAAGFAATLLLAGPASAHNQCTNHAPPASQAGETKVNTVNGGYVYGKQTGTSSGYIGIRGGNGWLEAGGGGNNAYVKGHSNPDAVNGELNSANSKKVCVNGNAPA